MPAFAAAGGLMLGGAVAGPGAIAAGGALMLTGGGAGSAGTCGGAVALGSAFGRASDGVLGTGDDAFGSSLRSGVATGLVAVCFAMMPWKFWVSAATCSELTEPPWL